MKQMEAIGWLGKWSRVLLAFTTTGSCSIIFIAFGNQACVCQFGSTHTPVALSSGIFLSIAAITLNGGKV